MSVWELVLYNRCDFVQGHNINQCRLKETIRNGVIFATVVAAVMLFKVRRRAASGTGRAFHQSSTTSN